MGLDDNLTRDCDSGIGLFGHWFEFDQPDTSHEGLLFRHYTETPEETLPDAGIGLFHYNEY